MPSRVVVPIRKDFMPFGLSAVKRLAVRYVTTNQERLAVACVLVALSPRPAFIEDRKINHTKRLTASVHGLAPVGMLWGHDQDTASPRLLQPLYAVLSTDSFGHYSCAGTPLHSNTWRFRCGGFLIAIIIAPHVLWQRVKPPIDSHVPEVACDGSKA